MSITKDIRSYADTARTQGKQVLDQAQAQLNDVTGQANEFVNKLAERANVSALASKATGTAHELREQAEKAINLDAIKAAVEPYLTQVKGRRASVTDRAEDLYHTVKADPRIAKLVTTAESVTGGVVEAVQEKLVKPAQHLIGRDEKAAAAKPAAAKPAAAKPAAGGAAAASKPATTRVKSATKATATKASKTAKSDNA